jgi:hypothetical protein
VVQQQATLAFIDVFRYVAMAALVMAPSRCCLRRLRAPSAIDARRVVWSTTTARTNRANERKSRATAALPTAVLGMRHARSDGLGEFSEAQPHRRHFREQCLVLRCARQLSQP